MNKQSSECNKLRTHWDTGDYHEGVQVSRVGRVGKTNELGTRGVLESETMVATSQMTLNVTEDEGPVIAVPRVPNFRLGMCSSVSTSPGLPKTESVERLGSEVEALNSPTERRKGAGRGAQWAALIKNAVAISFSGELSHG